MEVLSNENEVDNSWVFDLEDKIYTIIKTRAIRELKTKYPNINFTKTSLPTNTKIKYPCVYIHELPALEIGQDLDGRDINAVMYSMQVEVVTDKSQSDVKVVMAQLVKLFKELRFQITQFPEFINGTTYYRSIFRCRRTIGQSDDLNK